MLVTKIWIFANFGWRKYALVIETAIGLVNGLSPDWHQAIIYTNAGLLIYWARGNRFRWNKDQIQYFDWRIHLKISSAKRQPFNLLNDCHGRNHGVSKLPVLILNLAEHGTTRKIAWTSCHLFVQRQRWNNTWTWKNSNANTTFGVNSFNSFTQNVCYNYILYYVYMYIYCDYWYLRSSNVVDISRKIHIKREHFWFAFRQYHIKDYWHLMPSNAVRAFLMMRTM